jgi:poly-D-alanine transfer protein DltD
MAAIENDIKRVYTKLQQLLKQYLLLQKEKEKLKEEIKQLQQNKELQLEQIEQFQIQVSLLKAASSQMNEPDKRVFEKRINQYLKDIDKCITLLSE